MEGVSPATAVQCIQSERADQSLRVYSPKDRPWDTRRAQSDDVASIYAAAAEFERYAVRMADCGGLLRFAWLTNTETGESHFKLREAHFCRVRHCPICQWRRSLMWQARFYSELPRLLEQHPTARWLFLTLTVRNCPIAELGTTLTTMNTAWRRLIARTPFQQVLGWVRTTEVTRGADGSAHPHFHALLMVPPSYFGKSYIKQAAWSEMWQHSLRADYTPVVDIRTVKAKDANGIRQAAAETLKYSTKPSDMLRDDDWFLELTRQTHKRRFVATGGALKDVLREAQESDSELVHAGDSDSEGLQDDGTRLAFGWARTNRRYIRAPSGDVTD